MSETLRFCFGSFESSVIIRRTLPSPLYFTGAENPASPPETPEIPRFLTVCDGNTREFALNFQSDPLVLAAGEENKTWPAVERILTEGRKRGLGRDGFFVGVGGGVVCDLTAFAASVYMRGAGLILVPTTLLAMADAAVGGKTGFDLDGIKNFAGTFYPASRVFIALDTLEKLPGREWKSGAAELIKAAVLDTEEGALERLNESFLARTGRQNPEAALLRAIRIKGALVEKDPRETGTCRELLNLGHTFGHALEAAAGLGSITHGEAVAWGMARSCELGLALGITSPGRSAAICRTLENMGYETRNPWPQKFESALFHSALRGDKKKRSGRLRFIVPADRGAVAVPWDEKTAAYVEGLC
ncbi:MAG: 3-dehydroquinate synthase [Treponema sp.]|jgi:3-dehydroquinate synthase|nr:3-dehydroquinate synthase [Treponema sp.]